MEEEKYCKENKKTLGFLKENKELIIMTPTSALAILGILYEIIRYYYSLMAERFYGIPKFYFYDSLQTEYTIKFILFLAMIMIFFSPPIIKRLLKKSKLKFFESLFYSLPLALLVLYLSLVFCNSFIINKLQLKGHDTLLFFVCVCAGIVSLIVYCSVFMNDLNEHLNSDGQKIDKVKHKKIKLKTKEDKIIFAFTSVVTASMIMTMLLMYNSILPFPENKKNYEIIKESNTECKVIICHYKDLAILMNGKISWSDEEKISHLKIVIGEYKLESVENKELGYCRFDKVSCENKQSSDVK